MKRTTFLTALVIGATLLLGSVAGATKPDATAKQAAKAECKAAKKADKVAFKATYGSMARCVKGEKANSSEEIDNASEECRAEEEADPAAFAAKYGTNYNAKNAFGKCVSSKVKDEQTSDVEEFDNAAQECRAERAADRDAFKETYGTNKNGKNAFGKCVSSKVADDGEEGEEDPA
jgi:hypothetical protein